MSGRASGAARLRGALIGCGFFAVNQLHGWADIADAEIVALCDRDPAHVALSTSSTSHAACGATCRG